MRLKTAGGWKTTWSRTEKDQIGISKAALPEILQVWMSVTASKNNSSRTDDLFFMLTFTHRNIIQYVLIRHLIYEFTFYSIYTHFTQEFKVNEPSTQHLMDDTKWKHFANANCGQLFIHSTIYQSHCMKITAKIVSQVMQKRSTCQKCHMYRS